MSSFRLAAAECVRVG